MFSQFSLYWDILNGNITLVVVRFKAIGAAPIMKQNFYKISESNKFFTVIQFLRKECGLSNSNTPIVRFFILEDK